MNELCIDILKLSLPECFIYKVPPLRSAAGHRAEDWDLAQPLVTGCLRIYENKNELKIILYSLVNNNSTNRSDDNIKLFGECVIPHNNNEKFRSMSEKVTVYCDGVVDSSRYYVLRLVNRSDNKTLMIGIGFR